MTVNQYMTHEHRECDEQFATLENEVDSGDLTKAKLLLAEFLDHMRLHFAMEEEVMFPLFNSAEGGGCNPTGVMIMEHDQMRNIFLALEEALAQGDREKFLGASENLLFVMQQHNMKEEQIMYNMVDNTLPSGSVIEQMERLRA